MVSDELSLEENEKLMNLLKKHRKVIGYSINDPKGLSPAFCTHRIPMDRVENGQFLSRSVPTIFLHYAFVPIFTEL
jgi:hypothetical protein